MTIATLFNQINSAYRGTDNDAPATSTTEWTLWLNTTNRKIAEWTNDHKNVWSSNFLLDKPNELGTVTTTATTTLTGTSTYFTDYLVGDIIIVSGETARTIATITSNTVLTVTVAFSNTASTKTFTHKSIIKTDVQSYSVHRTLYSPSDYVLVTTSVTGNDVKFILGKPQERDMNLDQVYLSGRNPQTLTFYDTISSSTNAQIIGQTIKIPGYYFTTELSTETDDILIDDPYWLVYAVASELAFNDLTYSDKAPDLNQKANSLYAAMVSNNRRGTNDYPRIARTNVPRISGVHNKYPTNGDW